MRELGDLSNTLYVNYILQNSNYDFNFPVFSPINNTIDIKQYSYTLPWVFLDKHSNYVKPRSSNHSKIPLPTLFN